jgi:hypothetical protein
MHDIAETPNPLWTRARAMFARAVETIRLRQGFGGQVGDAASRFLAQLASLKLMSPALRRDIVAWLAPLEHVVRKLLLAEAAEIHRAERERAASGPRLVLVPLRSPGWSARLLPRLCASAAEKCEPGGSRSNLPASRLDMSRPETWRAQFSFALPRDPHRVPESRAPRIRALWGETVSDTHASTVPSEQATELDTRACHSSSPFRLARRFEALRRVLEDPRPHAERLARALAREVRRFSQAAQRYLFAPCRTNDYDPADPRLGLEAISAAFASPAAFGDSS